jgi:hypothetical protein
MLIIGGVHVPFVVSISLDADGGEVSHREEFDTFGAAREALEGFIFAHDDDVHDYRIDLERIGLRGGDLIRFDIEERRAPGREPREVSVSRVCGAWSISWAQPALTR